MTRRYRSFKSLVANLPPSSCTIGRSSGGMTGRTSKIIHSGRLPLLRNASMISMRLTARRRFCPEEFSSITFLSSALSLSRSTAMSSSLMASAPMPVLNEPAPNCSSFSIFSRSVMTCFMARSVVPGSSTTWQAKYSTCSSAFGLMSSMRAMREGTPLKYHMCDTGAASSICPMRSRRTLLLVTSTPHLSQMTPL